METKVCPKCEKELPIDAFYVYKKTGNLFKNCKSCLLEKQRQGNVKSDAVNDKMLWAINKNKPGEFSNEEQKRLVHQLLNLMGWVHNPDKNFWYRKGIRDANGNWDRIVPKTKKTNDVRRRRRTYDEKKVLQLRKEGLLLREIAVIMDCSRPTIRKILMKHNEK